MQLHHDYDYAQWILDLFQSVFLEVFSRNTTSHKPHREACLFCIRQLSSLYGMWFTKTFPQLDFYLEFQYCGSVGIQKYEVIFQEIILTDNKSKGALKPSSKGSLEESLYGSFSNFEIYFKISWDPSCFNISIWNCMYLFNQSQMDLKLSFQHFNRFCKRRWFNFAALSAVKRFGFWTWM